MKSISYQRLGAVNSYLWHTRHACSLWNFHSAPHIGVMIAKDDFLNLFTRREQRLHAGRMHHVALWQTRPACSLTTIESDTIDQPKTQLPKLEISLEEKTG